MIFIDGKNTSTRFEKTMIDTRENSSVSSLLTRRHTNVVDADANVLVRRVDMIGDDEELLEAGYH